MKRYLCGPHCQWVGSVLPDGTTSTIAGWCVLDEHHDGDHLVRFPLAAAVWSPS